MNKDTRIEKINRVIEEGKRNPASYGMEVFWEGAPQRMIVHKIPLDYLVYNKYNGRILSRIKSLETQDREIDATSDAGRRTIEDLLWDSRENANRNTRKNIELYGQREPGIITKDGIIVDGNRRAMLLERLRRENPGDKFRYFKAAVLPVTLDDRPLEIERLETMYQMGEDEKLGYNPIEKYLKADRLYSQGLLKDEIAQLMGETTSEVDRYLSTKKIMDEYLEYFSYDGIYTQLDNREDQFITLTKWLETFSGEKSLKAFDGYTNLNVDDLKSIAFDYIRAKSEGKRFRIIATGQKGNHFFGNKGIWSEFCDAHNDHMEPVKEEEEKDLIDYSSENLKAHLDERDEKYGEEIFLKSNLETYEEKLKSKRVINQPRRLLQTIQTNLDNLSLGVKQNPEVLDGLEVEEQVEKVYDAVTEIIQRRTPPRQLLAKIVSLLEAVKIEDEDALDKDALLDKLDEISRISSKIKKELGD